METGFWNQSLGLGRVTSTARGKKNIGPVLMAVRSRQPLCKRRHAWTCMMSEARSKPKFVHKSSKYKPKPKNSYLCVKKARGR